MKWQRVRVTHAFFVLSCFPLATMLLNAIFVDLQFLNSKDARLIWLATQAQLNWFACLKVLERDQFSHVIKGNDRSFLRLQRMTRNLLCTAWTVFHSKSAMRTEPARQRPVSSGPARNPLRLLPDSGHWNWQQSASQMFVLRAVAELFSSLVVGEAIAQEATAETSNLTAKVTAKMRSLVSMLSDKLTEPNCRLHDWHCHLTHNLVQMCKQMSMLWLHLFDRRTTPVMGLLSPPFVPSSARIAKQKQQPPTGAKHLSTRRLLCPPRTLHHLLHLWLATTHLMKTSFFGAKEKKGTRQIEKHLCFHTCDCFCHSECSVILFLIQQLFAICAMMMMHLNDEQALTEQLNKTRKTWWKPKSHAWCDRKHHFVVAKVVVHCLSMMLITWFSFQCFQFPLSHLQFLTMLFLWTIDISNNHCPFWQHSPLFWFFVVVKFRHLVLTICIVNSLWWQFAHKWHDITSSLLNIVSLSWSSQKAFCQTKIEAFATHHVVENNSNAKMFFQLGCCWQWQKNAINNVANSIGSSTAICNDNMTTVSWCCDSCFDDGSFCVFCCFLNACWRQLKFQKIRDNVEANLRWRMGQSDRANNSQNA